MGRALAGVGICYCITNSFSSRMILFSITGLADDGFCSFDVCVA